MNLFDKGLNDGTIFADPYPVYKMLRSEHPIIYSNELKAWIITRYEDIEALLRKDLVSAKRQSVQLIGIPDTYRVPTEAFFQDWLLYTEPPVHTQLKREASNYFSQDTILKITQKVASNAVEIIRAKKQSKATEIEIIHEYAKPLAILTVCELFHIPQKYHSKLLIWSDIIVNFMQGRLSMNDEAYRSLANSITDFNDLAYKYIGKYNYNLYKIFVNILIDGHEPIVNAIANSVLSLMSFEAQKTKFITGRVTSRTAVDELLRYDPPFQYVVRIATVDLSRYGITIPSGDRMLFMIASANRDERVYVSPDILDLSRSNSSNYSFGLGHHYCLGSNLAKSVLEIALQTLFHLCKGMVLENTLIKRHNKLGSRAIQDLSIFVEEYDAGI